ncbi:MAG TPA: CvpA family protein [Burkholderiaceae bacterium]|nr:CvpA family protein [Burkholderiaceae bacterium]
MHLNLVDVLLAVLVILGAVAGWQRGFLRATASLFAFVAALVGAFLGYRAAAAWLQRLVPGMEVWAQPLAFLVLYALLWAVLGELAHRLVGKAPSPAHGHRVNRALGLLPGAVNGLVNATIVAAILLAVPMSDRLAGQVRGSAVAERLAVPAEWAESRLALVFGDAVQRTLTRLTVQPQSEERIELPFTVQDPVPRPDLEAQMLVMVNEERRAQGLRPLQADPQLTEVARRHARDMFARGYFSHVSPEGKTPFDRLREDGVRYLAAGENLALARTLTTAHTGLMNSPGHRENILRPTFGRLGVGVLDGGRHGLIVTQNFRN